MKTSYLPIAGALLAVVVVVIALTATANPGGFFYPLKSVFVNQEGKEAEYLLTVEGELNAIQTELSATDALVAQGTLDLDTAKQTQQKIVERLNNVQNMLRGESLRRITPEMRTEFNERLTQLSTILATHQSTLIAIESATGGASDANSSVIGVMIATVKAFEEHVEGITDKEIVTEAEYAEQNPETGEYFDDTVPPLDPDPLEEEEDSIGEEGEASAVSTEEQTPPAPVE
jgi:hypothetical protein